MKNICLTLAYDGTDYHGFQRQPESHGPTIQGILEKTWKKLTGEVITLSTAGRTDTGVHAAGQVVNFFSNTSIPIEKIPKAFNSLLPPDIRILAARVEDDHFNARRSARWKRYDYRIDNRPIADVFIRRYAYHVPQKLNVEAMAEAAALFQGKHNFKAFCASGGASKTFERTLYHCKVTQQGPLITICCVGDGFLYNMVRIIAVTLIDVGKGRIQVSDIPAIIASQDRTKAGETAPAQGLTLTYVNYTGEPPSDIFDDLP